MPNVHFEDYAEKVQMYNRKHQIQLLYSPPTKIRLNTTTKDGKSKAPIK